jgi:acyl-CoA synthetase (AMP-forming)/AMP-acid ligase II
MKGLMQDWPLLVHTILDHAAWLGPREVVTRTVEGPIHRYGYGDLDRRARMIASACRKHLGIGLGDVIGTMAWNTHRHAEIWYGLMSLGVVVHTLNPRLFTEQLAYIVNHAEDQWLFIDLTFVPLVESLADRLPRVKGTIVMTDESHMPKGSRLPNPICYETVIGDGDGGLAWPRLDENTACGICYTSGTTGNPKGVLYSHRSTVLCAMMNCAGDALDLSSRDTVMPVVPMYHANAWSLIFAGPMAGAKLVLPGPKLDGASLYELIAAERVTFTAAVPTLWLSLLNHLDANPQAAMPDLKRVVIGGSACPEAMMRAFIEHHGSDVMHAWGMTEMSPIGSINTPRGGLEHLGPDQLWQLKLKQGRPQYGVEMKITDDQGRELPRDGKTFGRLKVRGLAVAKAYMKGEGAASFDADGWFDTGDVSTLDENGYMQITDRAKDVIKSGGEWISSIDLENAAMGCPGVAEAAAIGLPHPKWDERPLLVIVRKSGTAVTREAVLEHLQGQIPKWWMPDDVAFVEEIPHTATGKISKLELRERFRDYRLPTA